MKIGIDGRWILRKLSGIPAYAVELINQLVRIDRDNEYVVFFDNAEIAERTAAQTGMDHASNFSARLLDYGVFAPRSQLMLPGVLKADNVDVFHSPNYMIPFMAFPRRKTGSIRCVTSIHDMIPMVFPHHAPKSKKSRFFFLYRRIMMETGLRSDYIITGSRSAKSDIEKHLSITGDRAHRIRVIPDGVDTRFTPETGLSKPNTPRRILWIGRLDPYKNVTGMINAFAILKKRIDAPVQLRLGGPPDDRYPEGAMLVRRLGLENDVQWLGYLTDKQLLEEYRSADLFVLPSLYEGFGLTALEAMACGAPVVCSNASSLPEVVGDAAILVEPEDTTAIAESMQKILGNNVLATELRQKGLERATMFSWEQTARQTLQLYTEACN